MVKVLFVCLGNICRSPMAEAIFKDKVRKEGLENQIFTDSSGTASWHTGKPPHEGTLKILDQYQISSDEMVGRHFTEKDAEDFDYIVGMDESNIRDIYDIAGKPENAKIFRLLDLTNERKDVPDPYYTGDFQETYDLVNEGCRVLLEKIRKDLQGVTTR